MKRENQPLSFPDQLPEQRKQSVVGPFYTSAGAINHHSEEEEEESKKKSKRRRRRQRGVTSVILLLFCFSLMAQKSAVRTQNGDIQVEVLAEGLEYPWGMAFLPDDRLLFSEKRAGTLRILDTDGNVSEPLQGTPEVFGVDQGGMLDVALHPEFESNQTIYFTFAEPRPGDSTATTALAMATLAEDRIQDVKVIFRMQPDMDGAKHFGGRILISPDNYLFVTLAERFKFDPAQDLSNTLGTIVRLNLDGSVPEDNPFTDRSDAAGEIWSYGHRNIESAAFDPQTGNLWVAEMGPMGGDEFQQPQAGKNYGWPLVSWGDNYDGSKIPTPDTKPDLEDAVIKWTPTISPSGMIFYTAQVFPQWKDHALIGGLTSTGLVRVAVNGQQASEVERIPLGVRIRDVEQAPDGSVYTLTDEKNGKILKLTQL